jgi:hypothetical protein
MLKKFITWLKGLFMTEQKLTIDEQISYLSSVQRMDEVKKTAFQELQREGCFTGTGPDGNEVEIRADCIQIDLLLNNQYNKKVRNHLAEIKSLNEKVTQDVSTNLVGCSPAAAEAEISAHAGQNKYNLEALHKRLMASEQNLQIFKGANGITMPPEVPDSDKASIIMIGVLIVIEAFANMLFLRQGASTPTALLIAVVAAALNVTVSAYLGTQYRWINHHDPSKKRKGYLSAAGALIFILALNTFVAWARLKIASESNLNIVTTTFLVESFFLYLIGLALGFYAFTKGYKLDDTYPGYGNVYRDWLSEDEEYREAESKFRKDAAKIPEDMDRKIQSERDSISYANKQMGELLDELKSDISEWSGNRDVINNAFQGLVLAYRGIAEAYLSKKRRDIPAYFLITASLNENKLLLAAKTECTAIEDKKEERLGRIMSNREKIDSMRNDLMTWRANNLQSIVDSCLPR